MESVDADVLGTEVQRHDVVVRARHVDTRGRIREVAEVNWTDKHRSVVQRIAQTLQEYVFKIVPEPRFAAPAERRNGMLETFLWIPAWWAGPECGSISRDEHLAERHGGGAFQEPRLRDVATGRCLGGQY